MYIRTGSSLPRISLVHPCQKASISNIERLIGLRLQPVTPLPSQPAQKYAQVVALTEPTGIL